MKTTLVLAAAAFCLISGSALAQDGNIRQKPAPLRSVSQALEVVGPLEGGVRPVPAGAFDLDDLNDVLGPPSIEGAPLNPEALENILDTRSPDLTTHWPNGAASNSSCQMIDPQLAANNFTVAVLTWDTLAWYDKSGTLLPSTPTFPNPTNTETLFAPIVAALDQSLKNGGLNPDVANDPTFLFTNGQVGDARIAFDPQRNRFLVLGTAKNNAAHPTDALQPGLGRSQRRTKFLFAISKTSDPTAGFYLYAANATPNDGACNSESDAEPCPGSDFTPGDAGDYPSIGISAAHYVFTDHVNHIGVSDGSNTGKTAYIVTFNAAAAAAGSSQVHGHGFWFFNNPKLTSSEPDVRATGVIMPAIQRAPLPGGDANLLTQAIGKSQLSVFTVGPSDPPSLSGAAFALNFAFTSPRQAPQPPPGLPLNYNQLGLTPITAYWRANLLYTAFADCVRFGDMTAGQCSDAVHIAKLFANANTLSLTSELVFGERNPLDEPAGTDDDYGFPGLAVNRFGDLAVTYNRSGPTLPPEVRYSVWYHGESTQRPSNVLEAGTGDETWGFDANNNEQGYRDDTAGVAVDPFDDTAIWMAHSYAAGGPIGCNSQQIAVGKVFGSTYIDLAVSGVVFAPEVARAGGSIRVGFVAADRGDKATGPSSAEVLLLGANGGQRPLGTVAVNALRPGESRQIENGFDLPTDIRPGDYRVLVVIRADSAEREYTLANNQAESTGSLPITP